jgi:DNA-binding GntR family transcriptional regulator
LGKNKSPNSSSEGTIGERIYAYLKDAIIKHKIKPREIIYEKEIATLFRSSSTPVREAIKRLSAEGFIEISPHKPAIVVEASFEKFLEISETMCILDSYVCKKAVKKLTDEDLKRLQAMNEEMAKYCGDKTLEKFLDINAKIHIFIWNSIGNKYLNSTICQVFDNLLQGHRQVLYSQWTLHHAYLRKSLKMHERLLDALIERNTTKVNRAVKNHWAIFFK